MKKSIEKTAYWVGIMTLGIVVGVTIKAVSAWVEPSSMPPGGNIAAPLNTGNVGQAKQGGLTLNIGGATYGLIIDKGLVGIGTTAPGEKLEVNGNIKLTGDGNGNPIFKITNVLNPVNASDVATKGYVDEALADTSINTNTGGGGDSLSANVGLYSNKIVETSPRNAYTEVCFKNGGTSYDKHNGGESTKDGNCLPGDTGFIIEKQERGSANWTNAKANCLKDGMRLPEPFEWQYSCFNAGSADLSSMTGNWEWDSNTAGMLLGNYWSGTYAPAAGNASCDHGYNFGAGGNYGNSSPESAYRCVR